VIKKSQFGSVLLEYLSCILAFSSEDVLKWPIAERINKSVRIQVFNSFDLAYLNVSVLWSIVVFSLEKFDNFLMSDLLWLLSCDYVLLVLYFHCSNSFFSIEMLIFSFNHILSKIGTSIRQRAIYLTSLPCCLSLFQCSKHSRDTQWRRQEVSYIIWRKLELFTAVYQRNDPANS